MSLIILFFIFIILLLLLFLTSLAFQKNLYLLFFLLSKDKNTSIKLLSLFLLPGTVVHEISHMIVAELLQVPTGQFSFGPEINKETDESNEVKVGGLKIGRSDPIRRTLIGLSPLLLGLTIITALFFTQLLPVFQNPAQIKSFSFINFILLLAVSYLLFIISNTMFSSKKDLETVFFPIIVVIILQTAFWIGGIRFNISLEPKTALFIANLLKSLNLAISATLIIDLVFLLIVKLFKRLLTPPPR